MFKIKYIPALFNSFRIFHISVAAPLHFLAAIQGTTAPTLRTANVENREHVKAKMEILTQ